MGMKNFVVFSVATATEKFSVIQVVFAVSSSAISVFANERTHTAFQLHHSVHL